MLLTVITMLNVAPGPGAVYDGRRDHPSFADTTTPSADDTTRQAPRLTVRPREMATGTRTSQAGLTTLEGLAGYSVYVPKSCVGTTRSPLILLLHGGGRSGLEEVTKFQALADKYGMIVLAGNAVQPGRWDVINGIMNGRTKYTATTEMLLVSAFQEQDVRNLDTALTRVLRTHAIDPDRIALLGFSDGGSYSLFLGLSNLDVFSRIAPLSAMIPFDGIGPQNPNTQFFLSGGIGEKMALRTLTLARTLRQRGHSVMTQIGLRDHVDYVEDEDFVWAWLQQSWADPTVTTRISREPESDPVLTEEIVQKMTTFWTRFQQLPDSIRSVLRMQHQMQVPLTIGSDRTTVITMNLPALAAASPVIAALLDSVGLTAQTATAYRMAIIRASIARTPVCTIREGPATPPETTCLPFAQVAPTSVLGQNIAFWKTHETAFATFEKTGMWDTQ